MNLQEAVAIDPAGYQTGTCRHCEALIARRVRTDDFPGEWRHVATSRKTCVAGSRKPVAEIKPITTQTRLLPAYETPFIQTEYLLAVMQDDATLAELLLSRLMMGERYELHVILQRATDLIFRYRTAHDNL